MNNINNSNKYRLTSVLALMLIFSNPSSVFASEEKDFNTDYNLNSFKADEVDEKSVSKNDFSSNSNTQATYIDQNDENVKNNNTSKNDYKIEEKVSTDNETTDNIPTNISEKNNISNNDTKDYISNSDTKNEENPTEDPQILSDAKVKKTEDKNLITVVKDPTYPSYIPLDKIDQDKYYVFGQYKNNREDNEDRATYTFYIDRNDPYQKVYVHLKKFDSEGKEFEKVYKIDYNGELNIRKLATNISRNELEISALDKKNTGESTFGIVKENDNVESQDNKTTTYDIPLRAHHTTHFLDADTDNDIHSPIVASGFFGQDITPPQAPKSISKDGITYEYTGKSTGLDKFSENYKILKENGESFEYYIGKDKKQKVQVKRIGDQSIIDITTYDQNGNILKTYKDVKENDKILNDLNLSYVIINENPVIYSNSSKIYYYKKSKSKTIDNPNDKSTDSSNHKDNNKAIDNITDNSDQKSNDKTSNKPDDNNEKKENHIDEDYKKDFLDNLLSLSKLTNAEKEKYLERINLAKSNGDIYKIYNEAIDLNNSRKKNEGSNIDDTHIIDGDKSRKIDNHSSIKDETNNNDTSEASKETIDKNKGSHENSNSLNNNRSLIYVPDCYKYIKEGWYLKEDLINDYHNLKQAIFENQSTCDVFQHLLSTTSSLSKKYSDKLREMIKQSESLREKGKMALKEYCKILEIDN